jgi:hypothetical protein
MSIKCGFIKLGSFFTIMTEKVYKHSNNGNLLGIKYRNNINNIVLF